MNPTNVQVFKAHNPTGYFVWSSKFTFGKYKGKTIGSISAEKFCRYLLWITHAMNAEKFVVQFHPCILSAFKEWALVDGSIFRDIFRSKRERKVWIGGEAVPYQMGKYYQEIMDRVNEIPSEETIAEFGEVEDIEILRQQQNVRLSNTINELHELLMED